MIKIQFLMIYLMILNTEIQVKLSYNVFYFNILRRLFY